MKDARLTVPPTTALILHLIKNILLWPSASMTVPTDTLKTATIVFPLHSATQVVQIASARSVHHNVQLVLQIWQV